MKTGIKMSTLVALVLGTTIGWAKEPKLKVEVEEGSKSLVVRYDNQSEEANLRFTDFGEHVIFSENLKKNAVYSKKFNLKDLAAGNYFLELEDALKEIIFTIKVDGNTVTIDKRRELVKPVFRTKGKKVFLNLLNLDGGKVTIKVYDSSDRLVYNELVEKKVTVEKAFNFEKAYEDDYSIVIKDGDTMFYKRINID